MAKFTTQKKRFCDNILSGLNGEQSATRAGFSKNTADVKASQLLKEPEVIKYIEDGEFEALQKAEITAEWILTKTKQIALKAEKDGDWKGALKGIEMLGKNKKLWTDVQEHKFDVTQMGRVMVSDGEHTVALDFNVGQEPNAIDKKK